MRVHFSLVPNEARRTTSLAIWMVDLRCSNQRMFTPFFFLTDRGALWKVEGTRARDSGQYFLVPR